MNGEINGHGHKKKIALVLQGGGQRGIFTAGVLDYFLKYKFDPFSLYYGTSAGALNLCAYLSRQIGYGKQIIESETTSEQFFNLPRYLSEHKGMDLAWLIAQSTLHGAHPFDIKRAQQVLQSRNAYACVTNALTLLPKYFPLFSDHFDKVLQATSAIPLVAEPVEIDGEYWVDGGISESIPVREPYAQGADIIVVIRTEKVSSGLFNENENRKVIDLAWGNLSNYLNKLEINELQRYDKNGFNNYLKLTQAQKELQLTKLKNKIDKKLNQLRSNWGQINSDQLWLKLLEYAPEALKENLYKVPVIADSLKDENKGDKLDMFVNHMRVGYEIDQFLAHPPENVQIITISPEKKMKTKALMTPLASLAQDYQQGQRAAKQFLSYYSSQLSAISESPDYI